MVGTAVNVHYLNEPAYTSALAREFNMVEAEDAMKWHALRPTQDSFDFGPADKIVEFARAHDMRVRGHNLLWSHYNPKWLEEGHFTPEQLSTLLHDHITRVVEHYRGKVFAWDVVNEAFEEHGKLRESIWYNHPGIGLKRKRTLYIARAFHWAHDADPGALLFYNDAEAETINRKSDAIYAMVKDFKRHGVPIDGVGLQMHIFNLNADVRSISANIARFTRLGVQVHITEMDVALPVDASGALHHPEELTRQAELYRQIAQACLQHEGCTAFQTWGFTDKYSWVPRFTHGEKGDALLFDRMYQTKPSYDALKQAIAYAPSKSRN